MALRAFSSEYAAALLVNATTRDIVAELGVGAEDLPLTGSARGTRDLLSACGRVILIAPQLKAEPALAGKVGATCHRIAAAVLVEAPTHARAAALFALTARPLDAATLQRASAAAPYEPWPLNLRLHAVAIHGVPSGALFPVARADFRNALMSDWGRNEVARLYLQYPALRAFITDAAAQTDAAEQKAFVQSLRRLQGAG